MSEHIGLLRLPREVRFGFGARRAVAGLAAGFGERVAFVVDPFLAETDDFRAVLAETHDRGCRTEVIADVPPELPVGAVQDAAEALRPFGADVIVGYGGGSALDAAKLVSLLLAHPAPLDRYYGENAVPGPVTPLVAVPTTAGTGSEVTPVAVVSDPSRAVKVGISSPHLIPAIAVVDPELTMSAPAGVTAYAGIDAFVHAVESFTAAPLADVGAERLPVFVGRDVLTEPLSLEAARLIHRSLPVAIANPGDRRAREEMSRASLLAGMAFGSAGTHISHAVQYPIGALTHTPHGLGTGMLLPYVLQAFLPAIPDRLAVLGEALGLDAAGDERARAQATVDAIADLCARIGLPTSLAELGVSHADREQVVTLSLQARRLVDIAPQPVDEQLMGAIFDAAFAGDRSRLSDVIVDMRP
ncbi:iron-containing alcohol dehydrogenase [Microbacterium sp.]|uniref:iron-containing alcohol dehydrogenase n=1 Tax=Microbacterium sp. TaxID=51671 RepID=UPI002C49DE30|nr:iron-containing alcohol dehydrogenase [Microbacterium sp.]HWL77893.1 iron-containing alcohol dehydrogenase [Microbacterium sp.]